MSGAAAEGELAPTLVLEQDIGWLDHVGISVARPKNPAISRFFRSPSL